MACSASRQVGENGRRTEVGRGGKRGHGMGLLVTMQEAKSIGHNSDQSWLGRDAGCHLLPRH